MVIPTEQRDALARHLHSVEMDLGFIQTVEYDRLSPYWKANFGVMASEAIRFLAVGKGVQSLPPDIGDRPVSQTHFNMPKSGL